MTHSTLGLLVTLAIGLLVAPLVAHAQEPTRVPRIGVVSAGGDADGWPLEIEATRGRLLKAFR
jgi:hypothetical protein